MSGNDGDRPTPASTAGKPDAKDSKGWLGRIFGLGNPPSRDLGGDPGTEEASKDEPRAGDVIEGHHAWRLGRRLGEGASGAVFLAQKVDPKAPVPSDVALKLLSTGHRHNSYLRRELSSLLAMTSDRIPRVYDWSVDSDHPFVAMQFFPYGSLREMLATTGSLDEEGVYRLLIDLLNALTAAHQASVLHLDIKPANVLVDENGGYVLTDFGISQGNRITAGALPTWGAGTRGYQAPEQRWLAPDKFDMRTDLYGVGATVWAAWTGINLGSKRSLPLLSKSPEESHGLPRPSRFRAYADPDLESIVMDLLLQQQPARPGSAAEVLARIEQFRGRTGTPPADHGESMTPADAQRVIDALVDPLWAHVFGQSTGQGMLRFREGELLAREGERAHRTWILLKGSVRIEQGGHALATEGREGIFLGEVATLTGQRRTATVRAVGEVVVFPLNASQLEWLVTSNPAVGIRMIRSMAERLARSG